MLMFAKCKECREEFYTTATVNELSCPKCGNTERFTETHPLSERQMTYLYTRDMEKRFGKRWRDHEGEAVRA